MNFKSDKVSEGANEAKTGLTAFRCFPTDTPLSIELLLPFHSQENRHPVSGVIYFVFFCFTHIRIVSAFSNLSTP